ncbi:MAG: hypothetical protein WDA74_04015 [Spirochaetota bacterium]
MITLRKENFEYREWLALSFAREWIFSNGKPDAWEYLHEYKKAYSSSDRRYILKIIRMMDFFNHAGNMFIGIPWKYSIERGESCTLPQEDM